jgi:hypothetical protein
MSYLQAWHRAQTDHDRDDIIDAWWQRLADVETAGPALHDLTSIQRPMHPGCDIWTWSIRRWKARAWPIPSYLIPLMSAYAFPGEQHGLWEGEYPIVPCVVTATPRHEGPPLDTAWIPLLPGPVAWTPDQAFACLTGILSLPVEAHPCSICHDGDHLVMLSTGWFGHAFDHIDDQRLSSILRAASPFMLMIGTDRALSYAMTILYRPPRDPSIIRDLAGWIRVAGTRYPTTISTLAIIAQSQVSGMPHPEAWMNVMEAVQGCRTLACA